MAAKDKVFKLAVILFCIQSAFAISNAAGLDEEYGAERSISIDTGDGRSVNEEVERAKALDTSPNPLISYFGTIITGAMTVLKFVITIPTAIYQVFALIPHPLARTIGTLVQSVVDIVIVIGIYQAYRGT